MPAKRKLFITHAGELAHLLVRAVERDGLVANFVRSYAQRYGRRKLVADPRRVHELERTIGREALLVAIAEIRRLLPRAFAGGTGKPLKAEEAALCNAFYAEFLSSLERAMEWPAAEAAAEIASFRRDLEMYRQWNSRAATAENIVSPSGGDAESPFPDRCAILLDPAMMEQARRAASNFAAEIARAAARILDRLGQRSARPATKRRDRPAKSASRVPKPARAKKLAPRRQSSTRRAGRRRPRR